MPYSIVDVDDMSVFLNKNKGNLFLTLSSLVNKYYNMRVSAQQMLNDFPKVDDLSPEELRSHPTKLLIFY
jgi:hypothetical protein